MNLTLLYVYAATEATSLSEIPARVSPFLKACPSPNKLPIANAKAPDTGTADLSESFFSYNSYNYKINASPNYKKIKARERTSLRRRGRNHRSCMQKQKEGFFAFAFSLIVTRSSSVNSEVNGSGSDYGIDFFS